jgi:hypothetical protein
MANTLSTQNVQIILLNGKKFFIFVRETSWPALQNDRWTLCVSYAMLALGSLLLMRCSAIK